MKRLEEQGGEHLGRCCQTRPHFGVAFSPTLLQLESLSADLALTVANAIQKRLEESDITPHIAGLSSPRSRVVEEPWRQKFDRNWAKYSRATTFIPQVHTLPSKFTPDAWTPSCLLYLHSCFGNKFSQWPSTNRSPRRLCSFARICRTWKSISLSTPNFLRWKYSWIHLASGWPPSVGGFILCS